MLANVEITPTERTEMPRRTDTHTPSSFDPAEYTYGGFVDQHHEEGFEDIEDPRVNELPSFRGHNFNRGGCDHCGARGLHACARLAGSAGKEMTTVSRPSARVAAASSSRDRRRRSSTRRRPSARAIS